MSARWAWRRIVTGLFAVLVSPVLAVFFTLPGAQGANLPIPTAAINASPSPLIGQSLAFDVSFVNDLGDGNGLRAIPGPAAAARRWTSTTGSTFTERDIPRRRDDLDRTHRGPLRLRHASLRGPGHRAPVQICGLAVNQAYVVLRLPFGSFTPGQPAATVHVTTQLSNLADAGTPLTIGASGGFQFGADPLADPATDPSIARRARPPRP